MPSPAYDGKGQPPVALGWFSGLDAWWNGLTPQYVTRASGGIRATPRSGVDSTVATIAVLGQPTTCVHVGATSVSLLLHNRARGADVTSAFACTDTQGKTPLVAAGTYDATLTLHAADGATLATAPTQAGVTIGEGQLAGLAPVAFAVSDRGKLSLSLAPLTTSTNCLLVDRDAMFVQARWISGVRGVRCRTRRRRVARCDVPRRGGGRCAR